MPNIIEGFYRKENKEVRDIYERYLISFNYYGAADSHNSSSYRRTASKGVEYFNPVDMIAEFLRGFVDVVKKYISKKERIDVRKTTFKYAFTVPSLWTETAKATMIDAAVKANIITMAERETITIITECEAISLSCEIFMNNLLVSRTKQPLNFIVCDAGGGIVNLVTMRQTESTDKNGEKHYAYQQIGGGTSSSSCGAAYLDRTFRDYVLDFYTQTMGLVIGEEEFADHHMDFFRNEIKVSVV